MARYAIVLAMPGLLAGLSSVGDADRSPPALDLVEIGVAWGAAVRALLPVDAAPAPGLTGGVALYAAHGGADGPERVAGYLWADVAYGPGARYAFRAFRGGRAPAERGGARGGPGWQPGTVAGPAADRRPEVAALSRFLLASGEDGRLDLQPGPSARVAAGLIPSAALGPLAPERVLWVGVPTPLGRFQAEPAPERRADPALT